MNLKVLAALAGVASLFDAPISDDAGALSLCNTVPPPSCLNDCIKKLGQCNLCRDDKYLACISDICSPKDKSFAFAYTSCICAERGYLDFTTEPPTYTPVPPENCYNGAEAPPRLTIQERRHARA